jgi:hypothetical protein
MGAHVHKITDEPLINTALYVMLLMRANPLLGQVGGGWILEILTFWITFGTRITAQCYFTWPKKVSFSRAQPSPTCPRNGFDLIKAIHTGPYKS